GSGERNPSKQLDWREFTLPEPLYAGPCCGMRARRHRSTADQRPDLRNSYSGRASAITHRFRRMPPGLAARLLVLEPIAAGRDQTARVGADLRPAMPDQRPDDLPLILVERTDQNWQADRRRLRWTLTAAPRSETAADEGDRCAPIESAQLTHRVDQQ